ncbi:hypothetical protein F4859DRAFT_515499 [Xylaria cf. heliscus]|nr:hypothetical protein F4859DRAFT_515499 [Xylaria cf. heliscus]
MRSGTPEPLLSPRQGRDGGTGSLISSPSLTGTGSTGGDSVSDFGEPPTKRAVYKSLISSSLKSVNSIPYVKSESEFPPIESHYNGRVDNTAELSTLLSDEDDPCFLAILPCQASKPLAQITRRQDIDDSSDEVTDGECSWTSSSDESSTTASGFIETRKKQMIEKITQAITQWLRTQFTQAHMCKHGATANSCEGRSTPSGASAQYPINQVQQTSKRKLNDIDNDGCENSDDDTARPPHPGADDMKGKCEEIVKFACPYFKYNPTKYQQWQICPGPGWPSIYGVKKHLYRKHRQPKFRCARCCECFDSERDYTDHQRAFVPCKLGETGPVEGFNAGQERQLRSRKKKSHIVSETDKWNAEYILREIPLRLGEILAAEFDRDIKIVERSLEMRATESTRTIVAGLLEEFRELHEEGTVPNVTPMLSTSQGHVGPRWPQDKFAWFGPTESSTIFPSLIDFDFLALAVDGGVSIFGDVQLQDTRQALTDPDNYTLKQSDSGYGSNSIEQPNNQGMN